MSNYSSLKATINANIKANDNQEITGVILNSVLNEIVDNLAAGYLFKGVATTSTNPGSPDARVFYVASPGTYTYFGNQTVPAATTGFFRWDTSWHLDTISTGVADGAVTTQKLANGAVTEAKLASVLATKLLATGFKYMGVAFPTTNPGTPNQNVFYLAQEGTYANFGNQTVSPGHLGIFTYDGSWHLNSLDISDYDRVTEYGWHIVDEALNIVVKYDDNGFDVASLSSHLIQLVKAATLSLADAVFAETAEDGFFVTDSFLNIGMQVDENGVKPNYGDKGNPASILIAAYDSSSYDKARADYVCTGSHDELVIQEALNSLPKCGEIRLAQGVYFVDGFYAATDGHMSAITVPDTYRPDYRIKIKGERDSDLNCIIQVSSSCYESLDADTQYSVFSATKHIFADYPKHAMFENLCVVLPGNKKKIVCYDGWNFGSVRFTNCMAKNLDADNYLSSHLTSEFYGDVDCVGFRGTQGSNNAIDMVWSNSSAYGLGIGFAVSGEHLILLQCGAVACKYGYTFNYYSQSNGAYVHPITLINCCDERDENLPFFGKNGEPNKASGNQAVTMIDFNIERLATDAIQDLAGEQTPGTWRGSIDFTLQDSYGGNGNSTNKAFWEAGNGYGIKTRNQAQLQACTTSVRNGYAPNYCQQIYDTTLNKLAICIDPGNKTWVDANGNVI